MVLFVHTHLLPSPLIPCTVSLLQFAAGGNATSELDITNESVQRLRYFYAGNSRRGIPDQLVEGRTFAKYNYKWGTEYFIVYSIQIGYTQLQYILKEPAEGENVMSRNGVTDALIGTIGKWQKPDDKYVYVYDGFWQMSHALYEEVVKARWEDVILNEDMKKTITELMHKFFDSEDVYKDLGVPWKRGVIFHGTYFME
jgi:transitional endoplasmic reticulum ATPase